MRKIEDLGAMSKRIRRSVIEMAWRAGRLGAHLGPALSCVEILAALYGRVLNVDASCPASEDRDRFFVSKAHCVLSLYSALAEAGFIRFEELETFEQPGTRLAGHPAADLSIGLEYSGGSLGQALPVAVGAAIATKQKGKDFSRTFVLLGDGELDEGSNWEAFMAAAHFKLDNLTVIVDKNQLQYDGPTGDVMDLGDLGAKIRAFGWSVTEADGHDADLLAELLSREPSSSPRAIVAHTIKGKGVSFMEGAREWHHASLTREQYELALEELGR